MYGNIKSHEPDYILMTAIFALVIFGLIAVSSASVPISQEKFGEPYHYFRHQAIFGVFTGLIFWAIVQKIPYWIWKKFVFPALILTFLLLILVFIPGIGYGYGGAERWINLGIFSFQPAELCKLTFILYLAAWLEKKNESVRSFSEGFVPFITVIVFVSVLMILQPDIGTLGLIALVSLIIYFVAGAKLRYIGFLIVMGLAALLALIKIAPYRMNRLTVFLHPDVDPQGIGYQINQALLAIGSGGIFGRGLGYSRQKFLYLPEPIGDSIFAIIGEELGFIGVSVLIVLFLILAIRGFKIAIYAPDVFGKLVAVGVTSWFVFQAFINIAANRGLIPLTGIPLPFISYGGSALVVSLIAAGILLNISKYTRLKKAHRR